jgi:hypothetical protein
MLTIDDRCDLGSCPSKDIYRMVGGCSNCRASDILILQTTGHSAFTFECPVCGCREVRPSRLATPDEVPVA